MRAGGAVGDVPLQAGPGLGFRYSVDSPGAARVNRYLLDTEEVIGLNPVRPHGLSKPIRAKYVRARTAAPYAAAVVTATGVAPPSNRAPRWRRTGRGCSYGLGEDQHTDNTSKTALSGTRRHDRYDGRAGPEITKDAGELG